MLSLSHLPFESNILAASDAPDATSATSLRIAVPFSKSWVSWLPGSLTGPSDGLRKLHASAVILSLEIANVLTSS